MFGALLQLGATIASGGWSLIFQGALVAYGISEARKQAKRARQAREASFRDRTITVRSSNAPARIVYGETLAPGLLVAPPWTHGHDRRYLSAVIALANHECEAITDILFDGVSIGPLDARGYVQSGSPYFWTRREAAAKTVPSAPASGGTITLDHTPDSIDTVAYEAVDKVTAYLQSGAGYTASGRTITLTTDAAQGRPLTVTYQHSPPQRDTHTDAAFNGTSSTLPHTAIRILQVLYRYFPADDPGVTEGTVRELLLAPEIDPGNPGPPEYAWDGDKTITITGDANLQASPSGQPQLQVIYEHEQTGVALVQVKKFLGTAAGERDPDLEVASGGEWTSAHLGKGVCRIRITLQFDEDYFPAGMPEISAVVKGRKVYDPRTESTAWSDNPALCIADYQTHPLGWHMPSADVNWTEVAEAANDCDALVNYNASYQHAKYRLDGIVYCDPNLRENRDAMVTTIGGWAGRTGGKFTIRPAKDRTPTVTLDDSNLAGSFEVQVDVPFRDLFNSVRGQFVNPDKGWQADDFPPYPQDDEHPYITADGGRLYQDFDFPFTKNVHRAQRLAKLRLYRSRQPLQDISVYSAAAAKLQPVDTLNVSRAVLGWTPSKRFIARETRLDPATMTVQITSQEDAALIYSVDYNEYRTPDPTPNTTLPSPRVVPSITGATAFSSQDTFRTLPDGSIEPYVTFSWDAVTASGVLKGGYIELLWKRAISLEWNRVKIQPTETQFDLTVIRRADVINWQLRAVNGIEVRGVAAIGSHIVSAALRDAGKPQASGNLFKNSAFAWPMHAWSAYGQGEVSRPDTADRIDGFGANVRLLNEVLSQDPKISKLRRIGVATRIFVRSGRARLMIAGTGVANGASANRFYWYSDFITADQCGNDPSDINGYVEVKTIIDRTNSDELTLFGGLASTFYENGDISDYNWMAANLIAESNNGEPGEAFFAEPMLVELANVSRDFPPYSPGAVAAQIPDARVSSNTEKAITTPFALTYQDDLGEVSIRGGGHLFLRVEARCRITSVSAHAGFIELGWSPLLTPGGTVAGGRVISMPAPAGAGVVLNSYGVYEKDLGVMTEAQHTYRIAATSRPDTANGATAPPSLVIEWWQATLFFKEPA